MYIALVAMINIHLLLVIIHLQEWYNKMNSNVIDLLSTNTLFVMYIMTIISV